RRAARATSRWSLLPPAERTGSASSAPGVAGGRAGSPPARSCSARVGALEPHDLLVPGAGDVSAVSRSSSTPNVQAQCLAYLLDERVLIDQQAEHRDLDREVGCQGAVVATSCVSDGGKPGIVLRTVDLDMDREGIEVHIEVDLALRCASHDLPGRFR